MKPRSKSRKRGGVKTRGQVPPYQDPSDIAPAKRRHLENAAHRAWALRHEKSAVLPAATMPLVIPEYEREFYEPVSAYELQILNSSKTRRMNPVVRGKEINYLRDDPDPLPNRKRS